MIYKYLHNLLILFLFIQPTCTPAIGSGFTIGEEREVGQKLLYKIRSSFPVIDEPDIHDYINSLGAEVLKTAGRQYFDYHFFIVESRDFNAFAAPSGLIFFYTGIIENMNSEDELFSVLAHEIGHVVKRHLAARIEKNSMVNLTALGVALASLAMGDGKATAALLTGSMAAGQSAKLHFSRQNEEEADLLAYQWMKKLGRSPAGQERMLQTMRRIIRYRMGQVPQYLLTHPDPEARLGYVQALISAEPEPAKASIADEFEFLRFKYRVLSLSEDTGRIRRLLASIIAQKTGFEAMMAKYGLAQLDRQENNYQSSLSLIGEVIAAFPDKKILRIDKGIILSEAGRTQQALAILEDEYQKNPDNYAAYCLAESLLRAGKPEQAGQLFKQVAAEIEEYAKVYYKLAQIAGMQKKQGEMNYYLGKYNLYEGKLKLAKKNFGQAVKDNSLNKELSAEIKKTLEIIKKLED
ncbi:MAG: hypothetical protein CSB24_03660 [Deltaproteobacteria bacterium]|nr:MAG: hypothetical protein CSB24_03660 [Deltaproteobacteria bacterium]